MTLDEKISYAEERLRMFEGIYDMETKRLPEMEGHYKREMKRYLEGVLESMETLTDWLQELYREREGASAENH